MKLPNNTLLLADLMQLSQVLRPAPYGIEEPNFQAEHKLSFDAKFPEFAAFSEDLSVKPLAATGVNPVAHSKMPAAICTEVCSHCSTNCLNFLL